MYLTDLADVLRAAGLKVVEIPGWKTRGRPGTFAPVGVLCHHTAGEADGLRYATWMAVEGRSDLPAPLAQLGLDRKGTYYVLAAGRANHAGRCKPIAGLQAYPGRDYGDGNAQLVGIEAMNTGSEGWTTAQYTAYVRGCAALNRAYGFPVKRTLAHRETSTSGKPDPGGIDMPDFRAAVAATNLTNPIAPPAPLEDDMPKLTDPVTVPDPNKPGAFVTVPYGTVVTRMAWVYDETRRQRVLIDKIAAKLLSPEEIEAAAREGAKAGAGEALDARITAAEVTLEVAP